MEQQRPMVQPNFHLSERKSGVLLHVTSLPGPHGNGDLGPEARAFVDFLQRAGQRWWQVLPVNPVGPGCSPYSGVSAFAGNPMLIDLRALVDEGLLDASEVAQSLPADRTHYDAASELRHALLRRAFTRFAAQAPRFADELAAFRARESFWLADFALFMALKHAHHGEAWTEWDDEHANHVAAALQVARLALSEQVAYFEFEQFLFDRQWRALRTYAAARGVGLIGDAPIFVSHDSADVWAHQDWFQLDERGEPTVVSGVPPDYFSETGQRWGTPLYRWDVLENDGYTFWVERFRRLMGQFDVIRLDHFIGFSRYWEIDARELTAVNGVFRRGPGSRLFRTVERALGVLPFIAEDLGTVTPQVRALRRRHGMPGMRVLQFAFSGGASDPFLPHRYVRNTVAYTGTHDNDTTVGWFEDAGLPEGPRTPDAAQRERRAALSYLYGPTHTSAPPDEPFHWAMIRALFASVANTVIVPLQDLLGLGGAARMNRPGIGDGNWTFRCEGAALSDELAALLRAHTEVYGRLAQQT